VERVLGGSVAEATWNLLREMEVLWESANIGDRSTNVRNLVKLIRRSERSTANRSTVYLQRERVPLGEVERARTDAVSALHAERAAEDALVGRFRVEHLADPSVRYWPISKGGDLADETAAIISRWPWCALPVNRVPEWINAQLSAAPLPAPRSLPPMMEDELRRVIEYPPRVSTTLLFIQNGRIRKVTVATTYAGKETPLATLAALARTLAVRWRWHPAQATMFVLTGNQPTVRSAVADIELNGETPTASRIVLTVDPSLSPKEVAAWYSEVRALIKPSRVRPMGIRSYRLAQFVIEHPIGRWGVRRRSWNLQYPDWAETDDRVFGSRARTAHKLLTNPGWHLPTA
jgi:hypothetical protein